MAVCGTHRNNNITKDNDKEILGKLVDPNHCNPIVRQLTAIE